MNYVNTLNITDQTPLGALTVGQLIKIIQPHFVKEEVVVKEEYTSGKFVYGLKGIAETFNVSHVTAHKYKNTILKDAVIQCGRKIIVDVEKARKLFAEKGEENGK